jgi:hypothetical protein
VSRAEPPISGRYRDELVRAECGWLIQSPMVSPLA